MFVCLFVRSWQGCCDVLGNCFNQEQREFVLLRSESYRYVCLNNNNDAEETDHGEARKTEVSSSEKKTEKSLVSSSSSESSRYAETQKSSSSASFSSESKTPIVTRAATQSMLSMALFEKCKLVFLVCPTWAISALPLQHLSGIQDNADFDRHIETWSPEEKVYASYYRAHCLLHWVHVTRDAYFDTLCSTWLPWTVDALRGFWPYASKLLAERLDCHLHPVLSAMVLEYHVQDNWFYGVQDWCELVSPTNQHRLPYETIVAQASTPLDQLDEPPLLYLLRSAAVRKLAPLISKDIIRLPMMGHEFFQPTRCEVKFMFQQAADRLIFLDCEAIAVELDRVRQRESQRRHDYCPYSSGKYDPVVVHMLQTLCRRAHILVAFLRSPKHSLRSQLCLLQAMVELVAREAWPKEEEEMDYWSLVLELVEKILAPWLRSQPELQLRIRRTQWEERIRNRGHPPCIRNDTDCQAEVYPFDLVYALRRFVRRTHKTHDEYGTNDVVAQKRSAKSKAALLSLRTLTQIMEDQAFTFLYQCVHLSFAVAMHSFSSFSSSSPSSLPSSFSSSSSSSLSPSSICSRPHWRASDVDCLVCHLLVPETVLRFCRVFDKHVTYHILACSRSKHIETLYSTARASRSWGEHSDALLVHTTSKLCRAPKKKKKVQQKKQRRKARLRKNYEEEAEREEIADNDDDDADDGKRNSKQTPPRVDKQKTESKNRLKESKLENGNNCLSNSSFSSSLDTKAKTSSDSATTATISSSLASVEKSWSLLRDEISATPLGVVTCDTCPIIATAIAHMVKLWHQPKILPLPPGFKETKTSLPYFSK